MDWNLKNPQFKGSLDIWVAVGGEVCLIQLNITQPSLLADPKPFKEDVSTRKGRMTEETFFLWISFICRRLSTSHQSFGLILILIQDPYPLSLSRSSLLILGAWPNLLWLSWSALLRLSFTWWPAGHSFSLAGPCFDPGTRSWIPNPDPLCPFLDPWSVCWW